MEPIKGFCIWRFAYPFSALLLNLLTQLDNVFCDSVWELNPTVERVVQSWNELAFTRQKCEYRSNILNIIGNVISSILGAWPILGTRGVILVNPKTLPKCYNKSSFEMISAFFRSWPTVNGYFEYVLTICSCLQAWSVCGGMTSKLINS